MDDRLRLVQWLSPAFPIGGFAYSQGLEEPMATGLVPDAAGVEQWVRDVLRLGTPRLDAVVVARARAGDDPQGLADLLHAMASCAERAVELMEQGRAFATLIAGIHGTAPAIWPYPVAVGLATRVLRVSTPEVLSLLLHGAAAQLVSAATRFLPLGQTEAQAILTRLAPLIPELAHEAAALPLDEVTTFTPGADMAAMRHETLEVRIFRT